MIHVLSEDNYLIGLNTFPCREEFMARCGVAEGTYAGRIALRIFFTLTRYTLDLKREYSLYYEPEYATFSEFVIVNHGVPEDLAQTLNQYYQDFEMVLDFEPYQGILHGEEGTALLHKLLGEVESQ